MASDPRSEQLLIDEFIAVTLAAAETAREYLSSSSWELQSAITAFYNKDTTQANDEEPEAASQPPVPAHTMAPSSTAPTQPPKKKFATLGDLGGSNAGNSRGAQGHNDDGDDDDLDDDPNLYAGGEKSGLAVENPDDLRRKIIERAMKNAERPGGDDVRQPQSAFRGTARTLGGDDTPSEVIEDPNASTPEPLPAVRRELHFWTDGFSVDDGPLYRLDDPRNAEILAQIKQGRAPLHILNVAHNQEVDVQLVNHKDAYVVPKKKYQPFSGSGQRLGSPSPGDNFSTSGALADTTTTTAIATSSSPSSSQPASTPTIDENQPVITIQIRLGDGSRLSSRFNATHTIADIYDFVEASSQGDRPWVLMTTFPNKELSDRGLVLGDLAEFKRGGVVVQRWR